MANGVKASSCHPLTSVYLLCAQKLWQNNAFVFQYWYLCNAHTVPGAHALICHNSLAKVNTMGRSRHGLIWPQPPLLTAKLCTFSPFWGYMYICHSAPSFYKFRYSVPSFTNPASAPEYTAINLYNQNSLAWHLIQLWKFELLISSSVVLLLALKYVWIRPVRSQILIWFPIFVVVENCSFFSLFSVFSAPFQPALGVFRFFICAHSQALSEYCNTHVLSFCLAWTEFSNCLAWTEFSKRLCDHSVRSMCMYVCMCMYVVFCKIDHCIHIHWCIVMGLGHNDPWVESHMWPQQTWGQRSSRGQWPLVQIFAKKGSVYPHTLKYFQI